MGLAAYLLTRFLPHTPSPTRPKPNSSIEAGSGIFPGFSAASPVAVPDPAGAVSVICSVSENGLPLNPGNAGPLQLKLTPGDELVGPAEQMEFVFWNKVFPEPAKAANAVDHADVSWVPPIVAVHC